MGAMRRPRYAPAILATASLPAPVLGLNLLGNVTKLKPDEALILKNYIAGQTDARVRGGTDRFCTGIGSGTTVGTLMEWTGPSGRKFFAATATAIEQITSGAPVAAISSLTSAYWSTTMFTTAGGSFMVLANGADSVRNYDGTSWTTPTINNVTSSTLNFVFPFKARVWFLANNSTKAWYLDTSSISGDAHGFELGEQLTLGGKLIGMGAVSTADSGSGIDDFMVFVSSMGEVVVYKGTDPASATTWAKVGGYTCAPPINNRSFVNIGGDFKIATKAGIVSVRRLIAEGREAAEKESVSNKIDPGLATAFASYGTLTGWQFINVPRHKLAYLNVPLTSSTAFQYVVTTSTGAWTTNHDLNATCWGTYNDLPYFGTSDGKVYLAETGYSDYGGVAIVAEVKTSNQPFGPAGRTKEISLVQPLFGAQGQVAPAIRVNMDYRSDMPVLSEAFQHITGAVGSYWDYAIWDEALWSDGSDTLSGDEYAVTGVGSVAAVHMLTSTTFRARLNGFNLKYKLSPQVTT